jgi:hypothetical protein
MSEQQLFQELAKELKVERLVGKLGRDLQGLDNAYTVRQQLLDEESNACAFASENLHLIYENDRVTGYCCVWDLCDFAAEDWGKDDGRLVRDFVSPRQIDAISSDLSFVEVLDLFQEETDPYYAIRDDRVVGILFPSHLFHPRALLCYLALTFDLESAALDLCTWFPDSLESLPEQRRDKAFETFKLKARKPAEKAWAEVGGGHDDAGEWRTVLRREVLQYTTFIDKKTMIQKGKLLLDQTNSRIERVFSRAERVRNTCAHPIATVLGHPDRLITDPADVLMMTPSDIAKFVRDCQEMIQSIRLVMPPAKVAWESERDTD